MACDHPPPVSDEAINAVLDDDVTPEVKAHLARCSTCTARLEQTTRFEEALAGALHRWDCPAPAELADYHLGMLAAARERGIAAHVRLCPHCMAEVEELRVFLLEEPVAAAPPVPQPRDRGWRDAIMAQLLSAGPGSYAGAMRGTGNAPLIAHSSEATIVLEQSPAGHDRVQIEGQIADEAADDERWLDALVEVRRDHVLVATAFVDDLGGFSLGPVARGDCELRITASDGTSIVVEELDLA